MRPSAGRRSPALFASGPSRPGAPCLYRGLAILSQRFFCRDRRSGAWPGALCVGPGAGSGPGAIGGRRRGPVLLSQALFVRSRTLCVGPQCFLSRSGSSTLCRDPALLASGPPCGTRRSLCRGPISLSRESRHRGPAGLSQDSLCHASIRVRRSLLWCSWSSDWSSRCSALFVSGALRRLSVSRPGVLCRLGCRGPEFPVVSETGWVIV